MASKLVIHSRIETLHKAAKTGKYNWKDLKQLARNMGVSEPIAKKYLNEVKERLEKEGLI